MKDKKKQTVAQAKHSAALASYETSKDAGWVTLRLPLPLTEIGKGLLASYLQKILWQHGRFQWMSNNTLRLIAKRRGGWIENLLILEGWARNACRRVLIAY